MTFGLNNVFNKLSGLVDEYNNTSHTLVEMRPLDVKSILYINFNVKFNKRKSKFKVTIHV